jgi:hypothetical protein
MYEVNFGKIIPVPKHYAMKIYEELEVELHELTSALDGR